MMEGEKEMEMSDFNEEKEWSDFFENSRRKGESIGSSEAGVNATAFWTTLRQTVFNEFESLKLDVSEVKHNKLDVSLTLGMQTMYLTLKKQDQVWNLNFTCTGQHACLKSTKLDENLIDNTVSMMKLFFVKPRSNFDTILLRLLNIILGDPGTPSLGPDVTAFIRKISDAL